MFQWRRPVHLSPRDVLPELSHHPSKALARSSLDRGPSVHASAVPIDRCSAVALQSSDRSPVITVMFLC